MIKQHEFMGSAVMVLCAVLLLKRRWFMENTSKGRRLVQWFGPNSAPWILIALVLAGMVFGGLLAAEIIRPIKWK